MFNLGLSSFKDHPTFSLNEKSTLYDYAAHLSLIELDTVYYGIPKVETVKNWQQQVPPDFTFIVKAYGGMTGQKDYGKFFSSEEEMFTTFKNAFMPLKETGQLGMILFQFPKSFIYHSESFLYLSRLRHYLPEVNIAVEFRHGSWFEDNNFLRTTHFFQEHQLSLVAADEPQLSIAPVPFVILKSTSDLLVRLHGRNVSGWISGEPRFRTLYDYSLEELKELVEKLRPYENDFKNIYVIFNNNAGGAAAKNLLTFKDLLKDQVAKKQHNPQQLELF